MSNLSTIFVFIKDYNQPNKDWSCFFANKIKENNNFLQLDMNLNKPYDIIDNA